MMPLTLAYMPNSQKMCFVPTTFTTKRNHCLAPVFGADEFDGRGAITSPCSVEGSCHLYRIGTDRDLVSTSIGRTSTRRGESETSAEVSRWFA